LSYGHASKVPYESWIRVALVGPPENRVFPVTWVIEGRRREQERVLDAARRELGFYLVEKGEENPWGYAKYHCVTSANMYSDIHWSYYPKGREGERHASMVLALPELEPLPAPRKRTGRATSSSSRKRKNETKKPAPDRGSRRPRPVSGQSWPTRGPSN
jgi:hypothetical protein